MNGICVVVHSRPAEPIVETEAARSEIQQTSREGFRDVGDTLFDRDPGSAQQVLDIRGDTNARVFDELEGFVENSLDQRPVEEFEFGSH